MNFVRHDKRRAKKYENGKSQKNLDISGAE